MLMLHGIPVVSRMSSDGLADFALALLLLGLASWAYEGLAGKIVPACCARSPSVRPVYLRFHRRAPEFIYLKLLVCTMPICLYYRVMSL